MMDKLREARARAEEAVGNHVTTLPLTCEAENKVQSYFVWATKQNITLMIK